MSNTHTIAIKNLSKSTVNFFVCQQPAKVLSAGTPYDVVSTSLGTGIVLPHDSSGAVLEFQFDNRVLVAAHSNRTSEDIIIIDIFPDHTEQSGIDACWPIDLTPANGSSEVANNTVLSSAPLGLTKPVYANGIPQGNFGIKVPSYTPQDGYDLFCGVAIKDPKEGVILSCYVTPAPASQVFCAPEAKYYVKVGTYAVGQIIEISDENAALCDFTNGALICNVSYNADGSFEVTKS